METGKNRLKKLNRKLKKNPDSYEANLQMGVFLSQKDSICEAVQYFEKACEVKNNQADILFIIATSHMTLGNYSKCEEYFKRALRIEPDNFKFVYNYGLFLQETKCFKDAVNMFNNALKIKPDNYELLNDIGVIYYKEQDYAEAIRSFRKALNNNNDYLVAQINIAYAYLAAKDILNAQSIIERLEFMHPSDLEVRELRIQLNAKLNKVNAMDGNFQTELNFSEKSIQINPIKIIKKFSENVNFEDIGLSIVIPIKNEKENIPLLYKEITDVLDKLKEEAEIIFIDDGSTDGSEGILSEIAKQDDKVKIIKFRRNYGQTAAMNAGFKYSRGSVVITLDGDLQNDPADIPRLLEKMAEGYDLVSGWRKDRQDKFITRKIPSMAANRIINKLIEGTGVQLHDFGCTLKAYKRGIVKNIQLYGEMHRFIPVFAAWLGVKVAEIPVNHRPRKYGEPKYNLSRVSRVIFDLIVVRFFSDYMTRPIQFFGKIAKKLVGAGMAVILLLFCLNIFADIPVSVDTLILLFAMLLFAGLQILFAGLLGEIMMRSYFEGQKKDYYVVEKIINDGVCKKCAELQA